MKEKKRWFLAGKAVAIGAVIFLAIFGLLMTACNNSTPSLRSIEIVSDPILAKMTYNIGQSLSLDGIEVKAQNSDGHTYTAPVDDLKYAIDEEFYADNKFSKAGAVPVTVSYRGVSAAPFDVTVNTVPTPPCCDNAECDCDACPAGCDCGESTPVTPWTPPTNCEACDEPSVDCACEIIFSLYTNATFQGLAIGTTAINEIFSVPGLVAAGAPPFEVIANGEKKAIKMSGTAGWNGIDLQNDTFAFQEGDVIVAVVKINSFTATGTAEILLNSSPGAWGPIGANPPVTAGETVILIRTLTDAHVSNIAAANPSAIRLQMNNVSASVIEVYEFKIIRTAASPTVESIEVTKEPTKLEYIVGQSLNLTGIEVTATYSDGDEKPADIANLTFSPETFTTVGATIPVTITYRGVDADPFNVEVIARAVASIAVNTDKAKTEYFVGDTFSSAGIEVTATYNDGTTEVITTGLTFSVEGVLNTANNELVVTVTYEGQTAPFNIKVVAVVLDKIEIVTEPKQLYYDIDDELYATDISVKAFYNNGTDYIIEFEDLDFEYDFSKEGVDIEVTVKYKGKTAIFYVTVVNIEGLEEQELKFTINFDLERAPTISGGTINIFTNPAQKTRTFTPTAPVGVTFTSVKWYIDGVEVKDGITTGTNALTVDAADFDTVGIRVLTVEVVAGGKTYNRTITFMVAL